MLVSALFLFTCDRRLGGWEECWSDNSLLPPSGRDYILIGPLNGEWACALLTRKN